LIEKIGASELFVAPESNVLVAEQLAYAKAQAFVKE
jgi:hypothetical protein